MADSTFIVNFSDDLGAKSFDFDTLDEAVSLAQIAGRPGHIREFTIDYFSNTKIDRIVAVF